MRNEIIAQGGAVLLGLVLSLAAISLVSCAGAPDTSAATPSTALFSGSQLASRGRVRIAYTNLRVVPGPAGDRLQAELARPGDADAARPSYLKASLKDGCLYLPDNYYGAARVYDARTLNQVGILTSRDSYGWGSATSPSGAYLGTFSDTVDVYKPCIGSSPERTLIGHGDGFPLSIAVAKDGTVYATEWPTSTIDTWKGGKHSVFTDTQLYAVYYLAFDPKGTLYVDGQTGHGGVEVDKCNPQTGICITLALSNPTPIWSQPELTFPGGMSFDQRGDLYIVDEGNGTTGRPNRVIEYAGCGDDHCRIEGTLISGASFTSVVFAPHVPFPAKQPVLWLSNGVVCASSSSSNGCASAYELTLPLASSRLVGTTPLVGNAFALSIALWQPEQVKKGYK